LSAQYTFVANPQHLAVIRQGVGIWNGWRLENPDIAPDLEGADLHGADLTRADLTRTNLRGSNLMGARLISADLGHADLRHAQLMLADLRLANLFNANVSQARFGMTAIANVDLRNVQGLEEANHRAPSTIGIDTIYRSGADIPDAFLRGAGIPESFLVYIRSLAGKPIEFYSCFISYSTKDQEFADRLHADLQAKSVRCWFAPHHIEPGKKIHEQIDEAIRLHERLLLILSPASMESEWVKTEIAKARKRELKEKRRVLFPVRLVDFESLRDWECFDADTGKDSAREIREYFIPDFSSWKTDHEGYKREFERLLGALKTEAAKA